MKKIPKRIGICPSFDLLETHRLNRNYRFPCYWFLVVRLLAFVNFLHTTCNINSDSVKSTLRRGDSGFVKSLIMASV